MTPAAGRAGDPPRRAGRRPGNADTRGGVLAAARQEFAERGYEGATVRGIARAAGVDAALVHHYFGTKEQLFVETMQLPLSPAEIVPRVLAGDRAEIGERVVRTFLSLWGNPATRQPLLVMLRTATSSERAAAMLRGFLATALLGRIAAELELPDARLRAELAAAQMVGVVVLRYVIKVEPLASASEDEIVALVAPVVQHYLTG